ncbi:Histone acetyltransferase type B catalytic subunit [Pitangus sulphuratus]|nr:Histone acetyltransferase type B catalytic subunit [Pitangus sulphuratus]
MEKKLAEYKCNTNEAIQLKLVRFPEDLEDDNTTFNPEYSHQVFGDDEVAFGYKGLKILLYYIAGNLSTFFRIEYTSKVNEKFDCVEADDVESKIREIIPPGFCTNTDDFVSLLEKEVNFKPFGMLLHTYSIHNEEAGEDITYQIYKADMTCPGFREYHERLQTFLMWFIETASFIDVDDERWNYFLVFEKYNKDGATLFATVGYMTVYNYYVYPDKTRPRVSQMLILPPFQGEGHGAQLLETVHRYYMSSPTVLDITAEDPSENYVKLRDFVLVKLCQDLLCFSPVKLMQGFSQEMVTEAQQKLKINKQHTRRVYEILRLRATNMGDAEQSRSYRLDVKRRLIGPYKKKQRELAKMRRCLRPEEMTNQLNQIDLNMQREQLEDSFQQLLSDYRRVLERLAQACALVFIVAYNCHEVYPLHIKKPDYVTTGIVPDWGDDIEIKNEDQIQGLRQACQLARHVLLLAGKGLKVGMTTEEIDSIVHHEIIRQNAYPSPLGYGGFPKSVCTSVNNVVCHGIPDSRPLQDGDIINIDVTVYYNGYHGDTSETFLVGNVDKSGEKLVEVARKCRDEAIAACRPGAPFSVIGNTISLHINAVMTLLLLMVLNKNASSFFEGNVESDPYWEKKFNAYLTILLSMNIIEVNSKCSFIFANGMSR